MKNFFQDKKNVIKKAIIFILLIICLVLIAWFIFTVKQLYRSGSLTPDFHFKNRPIYLNHERASNTVSRWMTFDYVNVIFQLPKNYLKDTFNITDPRYPNVRIDHYAKHHKINPQQFLTDIQKSITNYSYPK